jgi:hypothetical protein
MTPDHAFALAVAKWVALPGKGQREAYKTA